ncbi:hypothetical protein GEV33_013770 [Tenebrio molitor]|uniref:RING-type E3 ubiquitin transferase n=1 Tax=Tenebrio molitor TaxID=7067 RepID=A0A8J6L730_TENMO|nr:hypothetical protein GEV33_013770 [Tenebrio molitor]
MATARISLFPTVHQITSSLVWDKQRRLSAVEFDWSVIFGIFVRSVGAGATAEAQQKRECMDINGLLANHFMENTKCSKCHNYLAFFPVYSTTTRENICGRCAVPDEATSVRNEIYERLAELLSFPCRYTKVGCTKKFCPKELPDHEDACVYRPVKCPTHTFTDCDAFIRFYEIPDHLKEEHGVDKDN